jgi:hypothetical protein
VEIRVVLADAVEIGQHGKVSVLGLGWTIVTNAGAPTALLLIVDLEPEEAGRDHSIQLRLLNDTTAEPVPAGVSATGDPEPLLFGGVFSAGRAEDMPPELPTRTLLGITVGGGLALAPGLYRWEVEVDGHHEPDWSERFFVRSNRQDDKVDPASAPASSAGGGLKGTAAQSA